MDLSLLAVPTVITFLLMLIRISGMMVSSPFFTNTGIPAYTKVGFSVMFAFLLFPLHAGVSSYQAPTDLIQFALVASQEFILGLLIGFVLELLFTGIRMSGEILGVQMGMSVSGALDPISGVQTPLLGQMYFIFALLVFLSLNIHHALIVAVNRSFEMIPLGGFITRMDLLADRFMVLGADMFVTALLVGLPVMGLLLASEAALGFVAKVMPQMNIFIVSLPLKSALGLVMVMVSLPYVGDFIANQYAELVQHLLGLYRGM